jgi:uncharacterized RDD family membrane protein YckC
MTAAAGSEAAPGGHLRHAPIWRRMASFVYEGLLLFGVVMAAGFVFSGATQQRHALQGLHGLQAFVFLVLGIYFVWFWCKTGQTLAMKTWHVRVVDKQGRALTWWRAVARYLLSWLWFLPALGVAHWAGMPGGAGLWMCLLGGVLIITFAARWSPDRQFVHDLICGTRLVDIRVSPARPAASTSAFSA